MLNASLLPAPGRGYLSFLLMVTLLAGACSRKTVSFKSTPDLLADGALLNDTLTQSADTTGKAPSLNTAKKVALTKKEERAAKEKEKEGQRKPKKKKKLFLGERIKRGYAKSGPKGRRQIIEIFYYLKNYQEPNPFAPARYYYDTRRRRIYKASGDIDPKRSLILHGPYKKMQNNEVIETGYYALGTRHLRWERFGRDNVLVTKTHYEMGFPRDANITYWDNDRKQLKEVIPYVHGELEGDYARFNEDGQRDWTGQFENGHRVGEWTNYWGFRNRRRYIFQYPESGYDPPVEEPELVKEYNRNGVVIFDKEKNVDKRGQPEAEDRPGRRQPTPRAPRVKTPSKAAAKPASKPRR